MYLSATSHLHFGTNNSKMFNDSYIEVRVDEIKKKKERNDHCSYGCIFQTVAMLGRKRIFKFDLTTAANILK